MKPHIISCASQEDLKQIGLMGRWSLHRGYVPVKDVKGTLQKWLEYKWSLQEYLFWNKQNGIETCILRVFLLVVILPKGDWKQIY